MRTADEIRKDISELRIGDANEAITRQRIIDDILYGTLSWNKEEVTVEERIPEDDVDRYIDYLFSCAQANVLVEAKRINARLDALPDQRRIPLKGSWLKGEVGAAVRQARDYARSKGVGFAIVTNGNAWIIFPVNRRDNVSFENSHAIVFKDAQTALDTDREEFVGLLSRAAIINGSLDTALLGGERNQTDTRRLNAIYDRTFSQVKRTSVFSHIEQEIITAFSEELLSDNPEILEKAYVETPDRVRFDSRIQMHVNKREQVLSSRPLRPVSRGGDMTSITRHITGLRVATRPIALLTLGLVGSGKTTFLNYVAKISARGHFELDPSKAKAHWIYVDFRDFSADVSPRSYIIGRAFDYVKNHTFLRDYERCLKHAYASDIENLTVGPMALQAKEPEKLNDAITQLMMSDYQAREPYVTKVLSYASQNAPIFLVIDNVDQREDIKDQSSIFLESLSLARTLRANLVLAMRDATYLRSKSAPVFDAFDFDAVYIDPPAIQAVLSKRFTVARNLLTGKRFEFITDGGARMIVDNAGMIVDMLSAGILNTEVGRLIEVAATGDTRLALKMTRQFLQYGYSSSTRAVEIYKRTGNYNLPPHEALRAIMCGNQSIYNDTFSAIGNPFDAKLGRSQMQFLRLYILSVLVNLASEKSFDGIEACEIITVLEKLGISERYTEKVIKDLIDQRYLFSRSHQDYSRESVILPSRLAGYVVRELIGRFVFIENVMMDTFIGDDASWQRIKDLMRQVYGENDRTRRFRLRKEAAQAFFDYAARGVQQLVDQAEMRNVPRVWCLNALEQVRVDFEHDLQRALRSALKNYGTGQDTNEGLPLFNPAK
ncbi:hypothetical protein [Hyphomicrobium sp.]|jgi:hypothetical protein|uniref:hypothetical protein n=1 Tax=Hyphomicrobium sp. TaxID=82 RepID=UPI003568BCCD